MSDENQENATTQWIRKQLDLAVQHLTDLGVVDNAISEARPIWSIPEKVMLGQIRDSSSSTEFRWLVCGDVRTDHIDSTVAATPREALRYFAMKWQMDAGRYTDPDAAARLIRHAEELYAMSDEDSLWQEPSA